jgi:hypothetical protein
MNNTIENLRKYNLWRRGGESIEQPDPKDIGIWIDEICEIAEKLEREREEAITRRMETIMQCELYEQERDKARELLAKALVRGDLALAETKKAKEELFWSDYQDKREMLRERDEAREQNAKLQDIAERAIKLIPPEIYGEHSYAKGILSAELEQIKEGAK